MIDDNGTASELPTRGRCTAAQKRVSITNSAVHHAQVIQKEKPWSCNLLTNDLGHLPARPLSRRFQARPTMRHGSSPWNGKHRLISPPI